MDKFMHHAYMKYIHYPALVCTASKGRTLAHLLIYLFYVYFLFIHSFIIHSFIHSFIPPILFT